MKKRLAVISIVVAVAAIPLMLMLWAAGRPPKTYSYPEAGFSITIPGSWQVVDERNVPSVPGVVTKGWCGLTGSFGSRNPEAVIIVVEPTPPTTSLDAAFVSGLASLRASPGFTAHEQGKIMVGDRPAKYCVYSRDGSTLKNLVAFAVAANRVYTVTCSTTASNFEHAEARFRGIVRSVKIGAP